MRGALPRPGALAPLDRSDRSYRSVLFALAAVALVTTKASAQTVDSFDSGVAHWQAAPASGVELRLSSDSGRVGRALRADFDFRGGGGWAAFRREVPLDLPENYEISFWLKGEAPTNTLELKLVDPSGENVWWIHRREFEFRGAWRKVTFRKRHVTFAWGPAGGGELRRAGAIEFAVTAGTGGKGTVWIDELAITPREPVRPYDATPIVTSTRTSRTIDFTRNREFGGIIIDWTRPGNGRTYDVQVSQDGGTWTTLRRVADGMRRRDYLQLPETEARYLRVDLMPPGRPAEIVNVAIMPLEWGASANALYDTLAAASPRGGYPKYFTGVQSYWTVIGENGDPVEAMMNEEGAVEVGRRAFSLEPLLSVGGRLITWHDAKLSQSLHEGALPIPTVTWQAAPVTLETTAWVQARTLWLRYRVTTAPETRDAALFVAVRPFQVNPSTQFLNFPGGATAITTIAQPSAATLIINGDRRVIGVTPPAVARAATFDQGDIVDFIRRGELPESSSVSDPTGSASAAMMYPLDAAERTHEIHVAVPLGDTVPPLEPAASLRAAVERWRADVAGFAARLPDPRIEASIRSNLAYVLVNRDRAAIQPGSRSYERSWIRDGSLTSAALLRLGRHREVREFIEWYAPFQYTDGKVPCCVDHRGADPVPENDSHGQLIYLIAEYFRYTQDTAFAGRMYPHVERAVAYLDSLRLSRRTAEYRGTEFEGLLPQSISHEGYSAKPMHSYWDDFFGLRGFKDAVVLADALGRRADAARWARMRDEFQADVVRSLERAMTKHRIDYLPGAAELGDFDATSTTVAINPAEATHVLPRGALKRTFDRYWENFVARRDTAQWEAYTPYEWRVVGTYVRLGERRRAHALLDWFMTHQRPAGWNHWAEVVFRDRDLPRFIGDMPHTWVGSDFIRSVLDMFAYEEGDTLVIGAGLLAEWLAGSDSIGIAGLHTPFGEVAYTMRRQGDRVRVAFTQPLRRASSGIIVRSPLDRPLRAATADGRALRPGTGEVRLRTLPRELVLGY